MPSALGWPNQRGPDPVAGSGPRLARALRVAQALAAESWFAAFPSAAGSRSAGLRAS